MLEIENLQVRFPIRKGGVFGTSLWLKAVDQISLKVLKGQTMAIVGESGSGKTTLALAIARLVPIYAGKVLVNGIDLYGLTRNELRTQRRKLQFIFQDPYSSLNPRLRAGKIVQEPLDRLKIGSSQSRKERVIQLFDQVGLRQDQLRLFPHQFSVVNDSELDRAMHPIRNW